MDPVMEREAGVVADALFTGTKSPKVFGGSGNDVVE